MKYQQNLENFFCFATIELENLELENANNEMNQLDMDGFQTDQTNGITAPLPVYRKQRLVSTNDVELRKRRRNSIQLTHPPNKLACEQWKRNLICILSVIIVMLVAALCYSLIVLFEKQTDSVDHIANAIFKDGLSFEQRVWQKAGFDELQQSIKYQRNTNKAKNVILFVGDGMGVSTVTATRIYKYGENGALSWESFPHVGLLKVSLFVAAPNFN